MRCCYGIVPFSHGTTRRLHGLPSGGHAATEFLSVLGGAAAAWPLSAVAQQPERMRRIGVLLTAAADDVQWQPRIAGFLQGLQQAGWTVGQNVQVDIRRTGGKADDTRKHVEELLALAPVAASSCRRAPA